MIGVSYCTIISATTTEIVCITDSAATASSTAGTIVPTNTGTADEPVLELAMMGRIVEEAVCSKIGGCLFSYLAAETPQITAISNADALVNGATVTVSGTLAGADLKVAIADLTANING
jgi:hypothetical protein